MTGPGTRGGSGQCLIEVMKRSTNGGASFVRNVGMLHADELALGIAPSNPYVVYTGSDGGIWRSTNNGSTWVSLTNADFGATQFQGDALHPFDRNFLMGGTQDNGTNCRDAAGLWSHCRDGDGALQRPQRPRSAPGWVIVDAHYVLLRAERSGRGSGRVYTIRVTCVDPSGNTTTRTAFVQVLKSQKGGNMTRAIRVGR